MRVVAGQAKGRRLRAPKGSAARYTSDFVRQALFNILAPELPGTAFLDLFAGVGAVGIEAASRGAREVVLVERDPVRASYLVRNVREVGLASCCRVFRQDVFAAIDMLRRRGARFEVIFLDPPYESGLAQAALGRIAAGGLLAPGGVVVAEHGKRETMPAEVGSLHLVRREVYGNTVLSFYRQRTGEGN